ncbi:conserved hypothetical protein [Flavobacterium sp. 9AF]|uniref:tetratricopeptide repeat protein n=1 Tax=Flavobacterium sp. 9AF TaxID=2653142 RepID=UPI0012F3CD26|nr:hypothetical protein [Flavobacterium sp. 9AF]VXB92026.1 conserved hypothetical protein [Flavobacterium sp. 9AF]
MDTLDLIDQYLKGNLLEDEKIAFEKKMEEDQIFKEEVLIQKQLFNIHDFHTKKVENEFYNSELELIKNKLKSKDNLILSNKIKQIGLEHKSNNLRETKVKKIHPMYILAASITILVAAYLVFFNSTSLSNYYEENVDWNELPSFIEKNDTQTIVSKGEELFKEKKYNEAIEVLETVKEFDKWYPYALLYIGASYDELNENEKAINTFKRISQLTDYEDNSRGYWYQLLLYLKINDKNKALEMKKIILENPSHYKYLETKELDF